MKIGVRLRVPGKTLGNDEENLHDPKKSNDRSSNAFSKIKFENRMKRHSTTVIEPYHLFKMLEICSKEIINEEQYCVFITACACDVSSEVLMKLIDIGGIFVVVPW